MQSYIHAPDSWKAHSKGLEGGSGELLHKFGPSHSKQANQISLLPVVSVGNRKKLPLTLVTVTTVVFGSTSSVTVTQNEQHGKCSYTLTVPFRVQIHTLPPPHCKEALVNFSDPFNCSGVPWREFFQCLANVLVWKRTVRITVTTVTLSLLFVTWFKSL